ncbi:hypothetical protein [Streptomyces sp. Isolate_219]|uniref:hypothetical protein n=1 Tax=Streptomyces sp. Isolate_219 TaxID=2950110 RepID=UPI0021C7D4B5|nr:hypothetical protein [Streptomyces sp. Isolate_219]MCR8576433.1 hypothetical protein [Streptomyces sp. Isolate_219]
MQIDANDPGIDRAEAMAERVEAYEIAQRLLSGAPHEPNDVLQLAAFLSGYEPAVM